ncbi:MAG: glutamine--fructose-6-phosphate transaminase (isomerizing) [Ferrimicrobium sp.]
MCGIVGAIGERLDPHLVLAGLRRLEYRGYDSAGLGLVAGETIDIYRAAGSSGSMDELATWIDTFGLGYGDVRIAVGHTRWATHGVPSVTNAHPHLDCSGRVAVVHNGIIENFRGLREGLVDRGHRLASETDSEVVAHLLEEALAAGLSPAEALAELFGQLRGHMAIVVAISGMGEGLFGIRRTAPLIAATDGSNWFFASDAPALLGLATRFFEIPEEHVVALGGVSDAHEDTYLIGSNLVPLEISWGANDSELHGFASYYEKEVAEEAAALEDTLGAMSDIDGRVFLDTLKVDPYELRRLKKIVIVGCGTSYHAGLVGRFALEHIARVPVEVDVASEFQYRDQLLAEDTLVIGVSQSGESLDTINALRAGAASGARTLAISNVIGSQMSRLADAVLYTRAGPEISVASTKTHIAQIGALAMFAIYLGELRGTLLPEEALSRRRSLIETAVHVREAVDRWPIYREAFASVIGAERFFFIGRTTSYPVALEGALKLKELSYLPAEAYPAGELKHGPIAMLDSQAVVVAVVPADRMHDKLLANIEEVRARGARVVAVASDGDMEIARLAEVVLSVPVVDSLWTPLVTVVPLQLLAFEVARSRGLEIDRPRNLAKTVTVE